MTGGAVRVWTVSGTTDVQDASFLLDDSTYSGSLDVGAGEYAFEIWGAAFGHGSLAGSFLIGDGSPALGSIDVLGLQLFADGSTLSAPATPIISIAEPVSAALALLGLLGMLVMHRRRARAVHRPRRARAIHPMARRAASA